ncbi:virion protein [Catenovulum agarivorans]|uniref:virion protein n=1 Tax=Catenovulum agarivorans TaxID=1172192 RepID=UPI0003699EC4|nr:virion protein [Catenovulum agarivorans]
MKLAIGAITLMTLTAAIYAAIPRSVRNNNPLNIRLSNNQWDGKVSGNDSAFEKFETPVYGFRAAGKILINYQKLYGLTTIEQIINRWAPPSENETTSYINHVAAELGVNANTQLSLTENTLAKLMHVMSTHETGRLLGKWEYFSYGQALAGAQLALKT